MGAQNSLCPHCRSRVALDRRGNVAPHDKVAPFVGRNRYIVCPGTGGAPVLILEPSDAARRVMEQIQSHEGRTTKQACDLLLELIRQDARRDPRVCEGIDHLDFQKVIAEVATDLVQERAFK